VAQGGLIFDILLPQLPNFHDYKLAPDSAVCVLGTVVPETSSLPFDSSPTM